MNYSETVKEELLKNEPKKLCCSRALCCGIFFGADAEDLVQSPAPDGKRQRGDRETVVRFRTEQEGVALAAARLAQMRFGKEPEMTVGSRPGHRVYTLTFASKPLSKLLSALEAGLPDEPQARRELLSFKCPECRAAFLRGVFLGCGSMTDPQSGYHLEFRVPPVRADVLQSLLSEDGEAPRRCQRRDKIGLYYKKSSTIGEFFSSIGDNNLYFEILNSQIERQIRVSENRLTNCETSNIEKTVNASLAQIAAVKTLFISGEIERLPQELRETALLRLEYDDDSLSKLAQRHVPPITKSGLVNRLRRIMEAAADLEIENLPQDGVKDGGQDG